MTKPLENLTATAIQYTQTTGTMILQEVKGLTAGQNAVKCTNFNIRFRNISWGIALKPPFRIRATILLPKLHSSLLWLYLSVIIT